MNILEHFNLIYFLCISLTLHKTYGKIYHGKVYHDKLAEHDTRTINIAGPPDSVGHRLQNLFGRVRRDTSDDSVNDEHSQCVSVSQSLLKDANHTEAIVHWSGKNSQVIFVLTREHYDGIVPSSTLYRSSDYGATFVPKKTPDGGIIHYYYSCPNNKAKLLFTNTKENKIYATEDEGETIQLRTVVNFSPDKLVFHPTQEDWILAYSYRNRTLYVSLDLGKTWDLVGEFVNARFYWAIPGVDPDEHVIHLEQQNATTGDYYYKACAHPYCRDITVDRDIGPIDMDSLVVQNEYIFVQKSTQVSIHLYVSWTRQKFNKAYFPLNLHPKDFSIINTDNHQVFIAADHKERTVNLYLSDMTGQFYVLSLDNLVVQRKRGGGFDADLYEVQGLKGVYIANQYSSDNPKTRISFDQGGEWKPIQAPERLVNGQATNCHLPECGLHLHLGFSRERNGIPYILSEENAPGLILAHGHIGKDLEFTLPTKNTLFMSRTGGYNWTAIFDGEYNYNILDQGGAMVVIPDFPHQKTNAIYYSSTEGQKWRKCEFASTKIQVDGVLNEPGINTLVVSIYGHTDRNSAWMIVKVNFTGILSRRCSDSDYVDWTPSDHMSDKLCLLGQRLTYKRRNQLAECINGHDYEKAVQTINCSCTKADYECDFGYEMGSNEHCKVASWFDPNMPVGDCPEGAYFNKSKGYRKIAADACIDNDNAMKDLQPELIPCPLMGPEGLQLTTTGRTTVATGQTVYFVLTQEKGSKKSTRYTFDSGEQSKPKITVKEFDKARLWNHTYSHRGLYNVTMKAYNDRGEAMASLVLRVEDSILGLLVDQPHGAQVNKAVRFQATYITQSAANADAGFVHYRWTFGDEGPEEKPFLTYDDKVLHMYRHPGNYVVTVEAINSVGSLFRRLPLIVYGTLKTVQLTLSKETEEVNEHTDLWRRSFSDMVKKSLMEELDVDHTRLEVAVLAGFPVKVDVSILPEEQTTTHDSTIDKLVDKLLDKVKKSPVEIEVEPEASRFLDSSITVVKAVILPDDYDGQHGQGSQEMVGVYVAIPILFIAVFVAGLIIMYYKRKLSMNRRYVLLRSHRVDNHDEADSLLLDDDDDDPPLDPNPDIRPGPIGIDDEDFEEGDVGVPLPFTLSSNTSTSLVGDTDLADLGHSINC